MPQAGSTPRTHPARGAGPRPAPRHLPRAEGGSQAGSGSTQPHERQGATHTPTQRQPAHPRLTLPRLTAPAAYTLSPDRIHNARLAQDLLEHGIIHPDHLDLNKPLTDAIGDALGHAITPQNGQSPYLDLHLARVDAEHLRLYLVPDLQASTFLNAHALVQQLDRLDAGLAPSLMAMVNRAHQLMPAYTPGAAYETVINLHWGGDESGEEAIEELRYELAQERGVTPDEIPFEEAKAHANEHFLTPDALEPRLPRRYYHASAHTTATNELLANLTGGLFPGALGDLQELISAAEQAGEHAPQIHHHDLSDWDHDDLYQEAYPWWSFMVGITDPALTEGPGQELNDVVYEMLSEYDQYVMQGSMEPGPSGAFLIPHTPEGLQQLADLTRKVRRQLELEARTYDLLAELTTKAASEAERSPIP